MGITATAIEPFPEVEAGTDLGEVIVSALRGAGEELRAADVVVIAHKVVSKAEGRTISLADVVPGARARELAREHGKDPRHTQVVLQESRALLRAERGVLICVTHHGFVCANAGVDASNVPGPDAVVTLPRDPDASARALRERLRELTNVHVAIVISDSFGRAWRHGQCDVAVGCAGITPLEDWRGHRDAHGRELKATWIATADELAAAADAARSKDAGQPVVLIRGAGHRVTDEDGPGAAALIRPEGEDLFR